MSQTIIVMHGMRHGKQNQLLMEELELVAKQVDGEFDIAFIESDELSLPQIIRKHLSEGQHYFNIVPLLLFSGRHYLEDIPNIMKEIQLMFPGSIHYQIRQPLCYHPALTNWIQKRINAWKYQNSSNSAIILLGHGSPFLTEPDDELNMLKDKCQTKSPLYTMMFYGDLQFEKLLPEMKDNYEHILVIPVFFYDGFLVNKIKKKIKDIKGDSNITIAPALNFEKELDVMLAARLNEVKEV